MNVKALVEFMYEHFGEMLGKKLLTFKLIEFGSLDIEHFTDSEMKNFIHFLMETLISKMRTEEQVNSIHMNLLRDVLGEIRSKIIPLDFMFELFGKLIGLEIIKLGKLEYKLPDIEKEPDTKQVAFMEKIIIKLFGFRQDFLTNVLTRMLEFLSKGPKRETIIESLMEENPKDVNHVFMQILEWVEELDKEELERILWLVEQMKKRRTKVQTLSKKKVIKEKSELIGILKQYLGQSAKEFIDEEKKKFGIDDLSTLDDKKREQLMNDFLMRREINPFSDQRKRYIKGKLMTYFDSVV